MYMEPVLRLKYLPYAKFLVLALPDGSMFIPNVSRISFSVSTTKEIFWDALDCRRDYQMPFQRLPLKMAIESENYLFNSIEHTENLNGS